jgi:hypothetical protein
MAIQTINIGNLVNDGLGDDLRTAFQKVNNNFAELEAELALNGSNIGNGAGVFKQKTEFNLEFRSIVSGRYVSVTEFDQAIQIASTAPEAFNKFATDVGIIQATTANAGYITIQGAPAPNSVSGRKDIEVTTNTSNEIRIKNIIPVTDILTTFDFGGVTGNYAWSTQFSLANSNIDFGTVLNPGRIDLDLGSIVT